MRLTEIFDIKTAAGNRIAYFVVMENTDDGSPTFACRMNQRCLGAGSNKAR